MRFASLSLLAFVLLPAANLRADDAADAKAIVARAAKAAGIPTDGKPIAMTYKVQGEPSGGGYGTAFTGEMAFEAPDKFRLSMKTDLGALKIEVPRRGLIRRRMANQLASDLKGITIDAVVVVNGNKASQSVMGASQEITGKQLEKFVVQAYQQHVISLAPLLTDVEFKLSTASEKVLNGKTMAAVIVERNQRQAIALFFDKETGLLAMAELKAKDELQGWKETLNQIYFEDYKDVGGIKFYTKMRLLQDGKQILLDTLTDIKSPEKLDPKLFESLK